MPLIEMTGKVFGRLTVLRRDVSATNIRQARWLCRCVCGNETTVQGQFLRNGMTVSCGCYNAEKCFTHGMTGTPEYGLWENARNRAKAKGVSFTLRVADIHIPTRCPVLGIELQRGSGKCSDASPTLDRLNPNEGYTADNTRVISHRANSIKRNASIEELCLLIAYMEENGAGLAHETLATAA